MSVKINFDSLITPQLHFVKSISGELIRQASSPAWELVMVIILSDGTELWHCHIFKMRGGLVSYGDISEALGSTVECLLFGEIEGLPDGLIDKLRGKSK